MENQETQPITPENVFEVDIPKLALNSRFGSLVFDNANKKLSKVQEWLKEAHDLGYQEILLESDAKNVTSFTAKLAEHLEWLRNFDIGKVDNAKQHHDDFENRVDGYYNGVYENLVMRYLPFLREEKRREHPDEKKLEEEIRKASQLRTELEKELAAVREDVAKIKTTGKDVGAAKGQRAAVRLAVHFDKEAEIYKRAAKYWLYGVIAGYVLVVGAIVALGIFTVAELNKILDSPNTPNTSLFWSIGAAKLVVAAALWYGLSFIVKNYNVNSHLAAINLHRAAVARTLEDFVAAEQEQEKPRLSEMLQNAADAMFRHAPIGYVSKTEKDNGQPVLKVVNDMIGIKES